MERPVSPDAPKMITFMLAMQRMLRVVLVSWENSDSGFETNAGVALSYLYLMRIGELLECEVDRIVSHMSHALKAD